MVALGQWQRFVIKGTGIGAEIWQTGFSTVSTSSITTQAALQAQLDLVVPFVQTWWTALKPNVFSSYAMTEVDAYQYEGASTNAEFQAAHALTAAPGTKVSTGSPVDTATVVSLRTVLPGRRGRGRMYIPNHNGTQPADGQFLAATSQAYGTATKAMLNSITGGTTLGPVVVSRTGLIYNVVTSLVTDSKPDVQRRRVDRMRPTDTQVLSLP